MTLYIANSGNDNSTDEPAAVNPSSAAAGSPNSNNGLSLLGKAAVLLETSSASLAGFLGRYDVPEMERANEKHLMNRDTFRHELEEATGMPAGQIERLLNL